MRYENIRALVMDVAQVPFYDEKKSVENAPRAGCWLPFATPFVRWQNECRIFRTIGVYRLSISATAHR